MTAEYLLEARCEELPPRLAQQAVRHLATRLFEDLMGRGLGPEEISTGVTLRRLIVCCRGLPEHERDREHRELGPPLADAYAADGTPTAALRGFAERAGVAPETLEVVKTERGEYLAAVRTLAGRPTREVLGELVPRLLAELNWGRRSPANGAGLLRWGADKSGWGRPLSGFVSLFAGEVLPFELGGVSAGRETVGHPWLSPQTITVHSFGDYLEQLRQLGIEVALEPRQQALVEHLRALAEEAAGELVEEARLFQRLALSCEIPGAVSGDIDAAYLDLPEEVVTTVLHASDLLPVRRAGRLLPRFVTVMDRADDPEGRVRAGYERAAAGLLSDARFVYDSDLQVPLAERSRRLEDLVFHPELGSYADKTRRLLKLVDWLSDELGRDADRVSCHDAATLLKADRTTGLVREHGGLRGVIGGIYARQEGYIEAVWRAIYEQHLPRTAADPLPEGSVARLVGFADRLDTLVGFVAIGQIPTGRGRDPRELRRRAQGLLRLVIEGDLDIDLDLAAARAVLLYGDTLRRGAEEILADFQSFVDERLRQLLGRRGFAYDEIEAVLAVGSQSLVDLVARLAALREVREEPEFRSLVLSAKRISNIISEFPELEIDPEELSEEAEIELHTALMTTRPQIEEAATAGRHSDSLRAMATLVPAIERFFAEVLVMDENEARRHRRIALLQATRRVFWRTARLKEMAVDPAPARIAED